MENIKEVSNFIKEVKKVRPNFNVWCYSGYTFDELLARNDEATNECLKEIDVLVDGEFIESKKDPNLKFKGSSKQRILDVKSSLKTHKLIEFPV